MCLEISPDDIDHEGHHLSKAYQPTRVGTQCALVSFQSIQIDNKGVYQIPTGKCGSADGPWDIIMIGDSLYGPDTLRFFQKSRQGDQWMKLPSESWA